jgi:methionyl-tRNA formyltransferase
MCLTLFRWNQTSSWNTTLPNGRRLTTGLRLLQFLTPRPMWRGVFAFGGVIFVRLIFMGSPAFSVPTLTALIDAGHEIVGVWSQPPRPSGRGQKLTPTAVHQAAMATHLPVFTPTSLKGHTEQDQIASLNPDAIIVVAYGLLLPQAVLDIPPLGCLNLHGSLLPRWRGAAPIQRAIEAGDTETGIQVMAMEAGLDTGPVYATAKTTIGSTDTTATLQDRLSQLGARLMVEALPQIADGSLRAVPQPSDGVTYANKIKRDDARIDWTKPAQAVDCAIRAFTPAPGAWCLLADGTLLKVISAQVETASTNLAPGSLLDRGLLVACGQDALRLVRVQSPGKPAMDADQWLRGQAAPPVALN